MYNLEDPSLQLDVWIWHTIFVFLNIPKLYLVTIFKSSLALSLCIFLVISI